MLTLNFHPQKCGRNVLEIVHGIEGERVPQFLGALIPQEQLNMERVIVDMYHSMIMSFTAESHQMATQALLLAAKSWITEVYPVN